ncbi:AraC family transcriptional regulator [Halopseudomonas pachastrellae]|nr:AraC family transcriptional regulator [Halopseudomonas pachastrellae]
MQLMFNPDWLRRGDSNDPLRRRLEQHLLGQHLASIAWQPDEQVLALCRALLDLRHEPDRLRRSLQAENLAHQVLWGFIRHIEQLPLGACEPVRVPRPLDPTARAIAWLEANLDQPLSVETAARATAMSTRALQRHFRRDTGLTVSDYVRGRRLEKVRDALHQEQISVSEAAFLAGYNHTSNFITAFRRHFGVTPGELCNADLRADGAVRCTPSVAGLGGRDKSVS